MDRISALRKTEIFGSLKKETLKDIATICFEKKLKKNQILFNAGDQARGLYIIVKGSLSAYRTNSEGREQVIHVEKAGTTIAEVPVFDGKPYPSTVRANEESEVLFVSKEDIKKLCLQYPLIALAALELIASRLRKTAALLETIALKEVDQRLAAFLLEESNAGTLKQFSIPSNSAIATRLGSVREVVSRAFSKLEQRGYFSIEKNRKINLLNAPALKKFSER